MQLEKTSSDIDSEDFALEEHETLPEGKLVWVDIFLTCFSLFSKLIFALK